MPIDTGVYHNIDEETYHRGLGWSELLDYSTVKLMDQSPAHCWRKMNQPYERKKVWDFGGSIDCLITDPDTFGEQVAILPDWPRRKNVDKERWASWEDEHAAKRWITKAQSEDALAIMRAVQANTTVQGILDGAEFQVSLVWDWFGARWKGRLDVLNRHKRIIADFKTARSADPKRYGHTSFRADIINYSYYVQAGVYTAGNDATMPEDDSAGYSYKIIAMESAAPYGIAVYPMDADTIQYGQLQARIWAEQFVMCRERGEWPCYPDSESEYTLPDWKKNQLMVELDNMEKETNAPLSDVI